MIGATEERKQMTFDELRTAILEVLPGAQLDEDNYGQIIVYTDMMIDTTGTALVNAQEVVPYVEWEEDQS
jgi:hypothetical protein